LLDDGGLDGGDVNGRNEHEFEDDLQSDFDGGDKERNAVYEENVSSCSGVILRRLCAVKM
jgi:hypothetical protein